MLGKYQPPVDGSLTYDFFKDRVLEIDYPHHRIRFSRADRDAGAARKARRRGIAPADHVRRARSAGRRRLAVHRQRQERARADRHCFHRDDADLRQRARYARACARTARPELFRYTDGGVNLLAGRSDSIGFGKHGLLGGAHTLYFVGEGANPVHQPDGMFEATVGNALFANSIVTLDFHAMTIEVRTAAE